MEEVSFIMKKTGVFSAAYWRAACGELKKPNRLALAALICALSVVVGGIYIPLSGSLQIHFTFFVVALGCAVYGPVTGMLVAAVADLLNYFLFLGGYPYFPGYMLSEMAAALIYGLFFYRQKITVVRIFCAKALVNLIPNILLGALWAKLLYGKGYIADLWIRSIKNILLLPLEVVLLAGFFGLMIPILSRMKLLSYHGKEELQRLSAGACVYPVLGLSCALGAGCCLYFIFFEKETALLFSLLCGLLLAAAATLLIFGALRRRKAAPK